MPIKGVKVPKLIIDSTFIETNWTFFSKYFFKAIEDSFIMWILDRLRLQSNFN
jgi:hypothetical protein